MKTFRVFATYQTEAYLDIKADNINEAHDRAFEELSDKIALQPNDDQWVEFDIYGHRITNVEPKEEESPWVTLTNNEKKNSKTKR